VSGWASCGVAGAPGDGLRRDAMSELIDRAAGAIGDVIGHPFVQTALRLMVAYLVVIWLASAWWAAQDIRRRTSHAAAPYLAAGAIILASPLFFVLALGVYRIVRPAETLIDAAERRLSQMAIAQELDRPVCASCGARVDDQWVACPRCAMTLRTGCERCGRLVELEWTVCPWCAGERGTADLVPAAPDGQDLVPIPLSAASAQRSAGAGA
jgi:RNA polymerase subunit RPABC4/transcription elongation factor Spt4